MGNIHLTVAMGDYDHVRDFAYGEVRAKGIDITYLCFEIEEILHRFTNFHEWDVSEMSLGFYVSHLSQDQTESVAIPVFPSRVFRHSAIYVRKDGKVKAPDDLIGKRVGIPVWSQTAVVYVRGYLMHKIGIRLEEIDWYQSGVNEPGRQEDMRPRLPEGVRYTSVPDRSLSEMLLSGNLDAIISARPPAPFLQGNPAITRLFPDFQAVEEAYWKKTGIFPIMHTVVIRSEVLARHSWVAMNLFQAFEEAKRRSLARALTLNVARFPIPWYTSQAMRARELFGPDFWPYGIEANRPTLEAFLTYAYEQGVAHRRLNVEELFPREVQSFHKE